MDLKYFFSRATVRDYTNRDINDSALNEMIEAASHAPTTGGMQLYSVVVTRDKAMKEKLAPCHFNQPMVTTAPVVLTLKPSRRTLFGHKKHKSHFIRHKEHKLT